MFTHRDPFLPGPVKLVKHKHRNLLSPLSLKFPANSREKYLSLIGSNHHRGGFQIRQRRLLGVRLRFKLPTYCARRGSFDIWNPLEQDFSPIWIYGPGAEQTTLTVTTLANHVFQDNAKIGRAHV